MGKKGSGEPDCSQRDSIMNHNERACARILRWRALTFIYAKYAHARTWVYTLDALYNEKT